MTIYLHKYMFSNAVPMHVEIKYIGHVTIIPEHEKISEIVILWMLKPSQVLDKTSKSCFL